MRFTAEPMISAEDSEHTTANRKGDLEILDVHASSCVIDQGYRPRLSTKVIKPAWAQPAVIPGHPPVTVFAGATEMNPNLLTLTFVHYPDGAEEGIAIAETRSTIVPRVGETVMMEPTETEGEPLPNVYEVIDVFYELPAAGEENILTSVTVYVEPVEDDEEDDDEE